ncbi:hypothetical protein HOLleu_12595 [Holothuria leucospilota]|uniref:Uncharacterized protein n=1 Tax=Holothuria leucospilota TaxID=206669 RepID=A0A9Q1CBL0_HOLLE|nr:hypothetical protein HOLleu_12595 [Holothuria leucospilota]
MQLGNSTSYNALRYYVIIHKIQNLLQTLAVRYSIACGGDWAEEDFNIFGSRRKIQLETCLTQELWLMIPERQASQANKSRTLRGYA